MTLRKKVANALSFAHLAGIGRFKSEDDEPEKKDDDSVKKGRKAEDDDPDKKDQDRDDGNVKKGKKAKDDGDDDQAEDDKPDPGSEDGDDDDKKAKKAKGSKAEDDDAEDDDDDEDEMSGKSSAAQARRRERARCATIFASKAAAKNPALAANLAFNTRMTRKEALVVLENTPTAASSGVADRASRNPGLGAGGSSQGNSKQAIASGWDNAFAKVAPRR